MNRYLIFVLISAALIGSCGRGEKAEKVEEKVNKALPSKPDSLEVEIMPLKEETFSHEIVSNGKICAKEYVDLHFQTAGAVIEQILVKNGQRVHKGQLIASLNKFKLENSVVAAKNTLARARLDLADALIGQGYDPDDVSKIPDEVMKLARLRSGVGQAEVQLREAEHAVTESALRAPYDGIVANLSQKTGNFPDASQPLCRVISTSGMEVDFPILESELPLVKTGDAVEVSPYSGERTFSGRVTSINPIVGKDGMVRVCATVSGGSDLYDGMNVRVLVKRAVEKALVVPKSAVVVRSGGRKVVFTYENGKAMWNYVSTSLENMNQYVVTEGLIPGQEVIVNGNLNLAHESPVRVINR